MPRENSRQTNNLISHISWSRLVALLLLSLLFGRGSNPAKAETPVATSVVVHARRFAFFPPSITIKRGQPVKLVLVSDDVTHGLTINGLGIQMTMPKGKRTEIVITPSAVGDFPGGCSVYCGSGHRDMEFVVHVVQ